MDAGAVLISRVQRRTKLCYQLGSGRIIRKIRVAGQIRYGATDNAVPPFTRNRTGAGAEYRPVKKPLPGPLVVVADRHRYRKRALALNRT